MKVISEDKNIVIFINKKDLSNVNFENNKDLESFFKKMFNKLQKIYKIQLTDFYEVLIKIDNFYGYIIIIKTDDIFGDFFINRIDMQILVERKARFIYLIEDIFMLNEYIKSKCQLYKYKNQVYLEIKKPISDIEMARLLENSVIIYNDLVDRVIENGQLLIL